MTSDLEGRIRAVCESTIAAEAPAVDRQRQFPRRSMESLAAAGLLGLTVPTEHGGLGGAARDFAAAVEEIARVCGSTAMVYVMHVSATMPLVAVGSQDQQRELLPQIAAGRLLATLAFSERGSGAHFYFPVSRAEAAGSGFVLNCEKSFVTSAGEADVYVVSTGSAVGTQPTESDLFVVRKDAPGLSVEGCWEGLGFNGNASAPMRLEGLTVPASARLGGENTGLSTMLEVVLPWFHVGVAAVNVGLARAALEHSVSHVKSRRYDHTGSRLADVSAIQHLLAEMSQSVEAARAYLHQTGAAVDRRDPAALLHVLQVKPVASQAALEVTAKAMRVCGGAAFARHLPVERFFRDAQAGAIMAPTNDVLKEFIGKALLGIDLF